NPKGSITIFSGADERSAWPGLISHAVVGGAINALVRTLGVELAPIRINTICPAGNVSGLGDPVLAAKRRAAREAYAQSFPLKRVADAAEIAEAAIFLMGNPQITGAIIDMDAGAHL